MLGAENGGRAVAGCERGHLVAVNEYQLVNVVGKT